MADWYTVIVINPATHRKLQSRTKRVRLEFDDIMHRNRLTKALRKHGILRKQERVLATIIGPEIGRLEVTFEGAI